MHAHAPAPAAQGAASHRRPQCTMHAVPKPSADSQELALQTLLQRVRGGPSIAPAKVATSPWTSKPSSSPKSPAKSKPTPKPKAPAKRTNTPAKAQQPRAQPPSKPSQQALLDLSAEESDRLFDEVASIVAAQDWSAIEEDEPDVQTQQHSEAPLVASTTTSSTATLTASSFKGFGAPPRELTSGAAVSKTQSTKDADEGAVQTSSSSSSSGKQSRAAAKLSGSLKHPSVPALRIFLYAAEASKTQEALQQAGWADRVVVSEDLKSAHAVVATKVARNGKHNKLQQGDRTARNAGVPFVCVGRHMTRDNLVLALAPVLQSHRARHGVVDERALASAIAKAGVSDKAAAEKAAAEAAKLQPGWKNRMLHELGLVPPTQTDAVLAPVDSQ